ncbi:hypothetical protein [Microvirga roseola]|uniref:hypothetical protein n=1 Tax=Microvirga roseola TaxID=2883126 RepID=UPI001E3C8197|nr:hypothetical protein [Microvirga roseola]
MTLIRSKMLLVLAGSAALLAAPALAQQNRSMQAQDNSCSELIRVLQRSQGTANMSVTLDQARTFRDNNNLQACRQALANIAQRAHNRAGVSADVMPRDFRSGAQGQQMQQARQQVPSQYRQERGRIVSVRPIRVRGVSTPNYLVVFETQPGRRVVADVGQNIRTSNLRRGAPIAVRGQVVRIGNNRALLLADAVRVGNRTYAVNRPLYQRSAQR